MALEFAIRPRIRLERPLPRRRRERIGRFALLMALYWLGIAGATVVLLRVVRDDPDANAAEPSATDFAPAPVEETALAQLPTAPEPRTEPEPAPLPPPAPPAFVARPEPPPVFRAEPRPEPRAPEPPPPRMTLRSSEAARTPSEPSPPRTDTRTQSSETASLPREAPRERPREQPAAPATSLPSCEAAAASADETLDLRGAPSAPDLPREAFAAVLDNGAYLAACALPPRTTVEICAAVQDGKVVGVSASTEPRSPALNACVRRAVAALRFPRSARLDVTRTRFDAAR